MDDVFSNENIERRIERLNYFNVKRTKRILCINIIMDACFLALFEYLLSD